MKLHRHLGISYNAAWRMKHKLMQVMMERDHNNKLSGLIELDDAYLGGERTGASRDAALRVRTFCSGGRDHGRPLPGSG